jgi:hypothetical protein
MIHEFFEIPIFDKFNKLTDSYRNRERKRNMNLLFFFMMLMLLDRPVCLANLNMRCRSVLKSSSSLPGLDWGVLEE